MRSLIIRSGFSLIFLCILLTYGWQASGTVKKTIGVSKQSCLATPGAPVAAAWSPDGSFLAAASDYGGILTVWNKSGKVISRINRIGGGPTLSGGLSFMLGSSALVFSPQDDAEDDDALSVWSVKTAKIIANIKGPQPDGAYQFNRAAAFQTSADQQIVAIGTFGSGPNIAIYPSESSTKPETYSVKGGVFSLSTFGSGRFVAIGHIDGRLSIIDVQHEIISGPYQTYPQTPLGEYPVGAIAGSPDGKLILAGLGLGGIFGPVANLPQGNAWAKTVPAIWLLRAVDGKVLKSLAGPSAPIRRMVWDPRGNFVAFLDQNSYLYLWQPTAINSHLIRVDVGGDALALAVSPDSSRIAVAADCGIQLFAIKHSN